MADRNLVLQLLITAKDEASELFGKVFGALNSSARYVLETLKLIEVA